MSIKYCKEEYSHLLQYYRSGQMTERQWQEHLEEDEEFKVWVNGQLLGWSNP